MRSITIVLLIAVAGCAAPPQQTIRYASDQRGLPDATALDIYEACFRHYFASARHPSPAPCYLYVEGARPPDALLARLSAAGYVVRAGGSRIPDTARWYSLQLGTTTRDRSYVLASDNRHDHMRTFHVVNRSGRWTVTRNEIVTI
jgi:hypothetical protein